MAKRRNKNKAKQRLAAIAKSKELGALCAEKVEDRNIENEENFESEEKKENNFVAESDTVTEKDMPFGEVTENAENMCTVNSKQRGRKPNCEKVQGNEKTSQSEVCSETEETLIFPREIDGETCLDVECGTNDAVLYLAKLCLGSKGSCILHKDEWLTPNEFQSVSGRETAKDWKRSIRHKGKSLKLLITKGLIEIDTSSPKKATKKAESPPSLPAKKVLVENVEAKPTEDVCTEEIEHAVSDDVVKPKTAQRVFKKAGKGRRGRRGRKIKTKQNLALVRPLSIQKPQPEPVPESPKDSIIEEIKPVENVDAENVKMVETEDDDKKAIKEEVDSPVKEKVDDVIEEPAVKKEVKKESADMTEEANTANDEKKNEEIDTRTDEERRLDEFVKSLRLTKTANVVPNGTVKVAPQLTAIEEKKAECLPEDPEDSEMPVLQKEPILDPVIRKPDNVATDVDPLHATVTPPPTPPSENPVIKKVIEEDQEIETFKVRLSSPSNGLKLTINREKVKTSSDTEDSPTDTDANPNVVPVKEQNIQSLLLQDALLSAKKYKQQLQQNKQQCSSLSSMPVRKPVASVSGIVVPTPQAPVPSRSTPQEFTKPTFVNGTSKPQIHSPVPSSHVISKSSLHSQGQPRLISEHRPEKARNITGHKQPKVQTPSSKSATPSVSDMMSVMPHLYGSLPFPTDSRKSTLSALQSLPLKDKTSPFGAHPSAAQANLLHPVFTQQLLMAMTQQLYSMYNIPQQQQQQQQQHPQQQQQQRHKPSVREERPHQNSKSQEIRHRHSEKHVEKTLDSSDKKRKHSEVTDSSDGVLDLSIKKQKTDIASDVRCNSSQNSVDAPIDFSLKRQREHSDSRHAVHNRPNTSQGSVRHSFPSDYKYSDRYTQPAKTEDKRLPVGCTCKTGSAIDDITTWSVDKVCSFLSCLDGCSLYAKTFREQGITGRLLPYLTTQHLTRTLGMKVGPALTLMHAVERKFREQMTKQTCAFCRNHHSRTIQI